MPRTHRAVADQAIRTIAVLTVAGLAALAGWISYRHMLLLAQRAGQTGIDAHAFPLTVDGLDLIGVLVLLADRRVGRTSGWLPWTVLAIGSMASICANVAVAPDNPIARAISGWSAVALLAAAKMLAHLFEPTRPAGTPTARSEPAEALPQASRPSDAGSGGNAEPITAELDDPQGQQGGRAGGSAVRRLPSSDTALARWRTIWDATRHLDNASADTATAHGVSLRTLQFIRAAGQQGHLAPPDQPPNGAPPAAEAVAGSNHHATAPGDAR